MHRAGFLVWVFFVGGLSSYAQSGADPAVTNWRLLPAPLQHVGSVFSMTFTIGNNGSVPITGVGSANRMQWAICLGKCIPNPTNPTSATTALSGSLLTYFDVTYTPPGDASQGGCFEAAQKEGVSIEASSLYDVVISAVATKASTTTAINDIGASCNIGPNFNSSGQTTDNDQASLYTHTTTLSMPVALVSFVAQAQDNRTVLLNWKTSWERANKDYVIERSKDLKSFEVVGEVSDVAGTSNSINTYRYVDSSPYRGTSYYRLRQQDLDGTSQVFKAEPVVINGRYGVYPNPVVSPQGFTLELDEPLGAVLHLYSSSGVEIGLERKGVSDQHVKLIPLAKLAPGIHVLTVSERGTTRTHRLLVQ